MASRNTNRSSSSNSRGAAATAGPTATTIPHRRVGLISLAVLTTGALPLWQAARPRPAVPDAATVAATASAGAPGAPVGAAPAAPAGSVMRSQAGDVAAAAAVLDAAAAGQLRSGRPNATAAGGASGADRGAGGGYWGGWPGDGSFTPAGAPAPHSLQVVLHDVPMRAALTLICDAAQMRYRFGEAPGATGASETAEPAGEAGQEPVTLWTGDKPLPLAAVLSRLSQATPTLRPVRLGAVAPAPHQSAGGPSGGGDTEIVVGAPRQRAAGTKMTGGTAPSSGAQQGQQRRRPERRMAGVVLAEGQVVCALIETRTGGGTAAPFYELARPGRRLAQTAMSAPAQFVTAVYPDRVEVSNIRTGARSSVPFTASCGDEEVPALLASVLGSASVSGAKSAALTPGEVDTLVRGGFGGGGGGWGGFGGGFGDRERGGGIGGMGSGRDQPMGGRNLN